MQYNSNATNQDCVSEIHKICGTTTATYPINDITRRFNFALDRYFTLAFEADGQWSFDDINQSSPPIDTQNIVSGTNRFKVGSFTEKIFNLLKLEVLDSSGNGYTLIPEQLNNLDGSFEDLYINAESGLPTHYVKYGDFIYVRPNPNYNKTAGLKAYFDRPASYMAATDTTKVPGVPVMHHGFLCRYTALPYLIEKKLPQTTAIAQQITIDEEAIRSYFSRRPREMVSGIRVSQESNR